MTTKFMKKEYSEVSYISGPLLYLENAPDLAYNAIVRIKDASGRERGGQVIEVSDKVTVLQVFEEPSGIDLSSTTVWLVEDVARLGVSREMIGRRFNGIGEPIDGVPPVVADKRLPARDHLLHQGVRAHGRVGPLGLVPEQSRRPRGRTPANTEDGAHRRRVPRLRARLSRLGHLD